MGLGLILSLYLFVLLSATWCTVDEVSPERFGCIAAIWLIPVIATLIFSSIVARGMTCYSSSVVLCGTVLGCYVTLAHNAIFQSAIDSIRMACISAVPVAAPIIIGSALRMGGTIGSCIVLTVGGLEVILAFLTVTKPKLNLVPLRIPLLTFVCGSILESFIHALIPLFPK